ncbi:MAG TPA: FAD-dependent oxidoreductase [Gemmataceae bacterium]|jgi:glycine oxidase|nr:FAD-dependent oxidoreductase [Gemmataceae bacterium]
MSSQRDVLIIGGGVIGLTTAYCLAQAGVKVAVVDRSDFGKESSWAGAGIISPGNFERAKSGFDKLRALSALNFPSFSKQLREETGIDNGYLQCGGVELESGVDESMLRSWRDEGIAFRRVPGVELPAVDPEFAVAPETGYYLPDMAQVRNPRHIQALIAACRARGAELMANRAIKRFDVQGEKVVAAISETDSFLAGRFLLASGAWSESLLKPFGWQPGIHPVRGQIVLFNAGKPLFRKILLQGKNYLVPRADGRILAGSTEEDVGFVKENTPQAIERLTRMARAFVPALEGVPVERTWAGLRPGSPDGIPYLGLVPGTRNLYIAAGHFRWGISTSPATGLVLSELLQDRPTSIPLADFALDRNVG